VIHLALLVSGGLYCALIFKMAPPSVTQLKYALRTIALYIWLVSTWLIIDIAFFESMLLIFPYDGLVGQVLTLLGLACLIHADLSKKIQFWLIAVGLSLLLVREGIYFIGESQTRGIISASLRLGLSFFFYSSMINQKHRLCRIALHASSFFGLILIIIPSFFFSEAKRVDLYFGSAGPLFYREILDFIKLVLNFERLHSLVLIPFVAALILGIYAAKALTQHGGTPDPLDPPQGLVTSGIYGKIRHPMILAEALIILSAAFFYDQGIFWFYAALVILLLLICMPVFENRVLIDKYRGAAETYIREVPAFIPHLKICPKSP
jgi:hypothetical protein